MFTGLVQAVGVVVACQPTPGGVALVIDPRGWDHSPAPGDSICVSGCCLTVAEVSARGWRFDVIAETLGKTTLGSLAAGGRVNLEHSLRADSLMGGHFVQGHVDGVGTVRRVQDDPSDWRVEIALPEGLRQYVTPKGSVTLEGVSLTIAAVTPEGFEVALIPTTLAKTTLEGLRAGHLCNVEADILAKTIVFWLRNYSGTLGSATLGRG